MNPKLIFLILTGAAVALEVVGDVFFKKWSLSNRWMLLAIGLAVYFAGTIFWAFSLKHEYLANAIGVFTILNLIAVSLIGIYLFKEDLSVVNKIGIVLGVASVALLLR